MRERNRFFKWYHRVRDGTLSREQFEKRMRGVERTVGQLLREAARRAEKRTAGMAREILQWEKCLWTFVDVPGLEPTSNFGERCIRHAIMYRKTSFGTQSECSGGPRQRHSSAPPLQPSPSTSSLSRLYAQDEGLHHI